MKRSCNKEINRILRELEEQDWRIERVVGKFLAWPPDGVSRPVPVHESPSDHRWRKNLISVLRRAGADIA